MMEEQVCVDYLGGLGHWYKVGDTGYFKECETCKGTGKILPEEAMVKRMQNVKPIQTESVASGSLTEVRARYCQSCGERIPLEAQICPKCNQWTIGLPSPVSTEQHISGSWFQKMGQEGLLALLGYVLMAVSAFLPWATVSTVFGQIELTGLQVAKGEPGIVLLVFALIGGLTTLVPRRTFWTGLGDAGIGIFVLLETAVDMSRIAAIAKETTTSYVRSDLGSGSYLAMVSGCLVVVAGIAIAVKSRSAKRTVKAAQVLARPSTGLRGPFPLNEQTINEEVDSGSPGVYALGYKKGKTFIIQHVGRSDTDVNAQLREHIGKYEQFKFDTSETPEAAFIKECELYHAFRGLDGGNHPDRPQGAMWQCPKCNVFLSEGAVQVRNQFCVNCGKELVTESKFCPDCGATQTNKTGMG
jgi:hypothetical protein